MCSMQNTHTHTHKIIHAYICRCIYTWTDTWIYTCRGWVFPSHMQKWFVWQLHLFFVGYVAILCDLARFLTFHPIGRREDRVICIGIYFWLKIKNTYSRVPAYRSLAGRPVDSAYLIIIESLGHYQTNTYIHANIHTHTHARMHTRQNMKFRGLCTCRLPGSTYPRKNPYIHTCIRIERIERKHEKLALEPSLASQRSQISSSWHVFHAKYACIHTFIHTYMYACIPRFISYMNKYIHTQMYRSSFSLLRMKGCFILRIYRVSLPA